MSDGPVLRAVTPRLRVAFICVENSCRSQIAEAFARAVGGESAEVFSAGSRPSGSVNPKAIDSMARVGYDLSQHRSKPIRELEDVEFDAVVTMGCGDACPTLRTRRSVDWPIPDPRDLPPAEFDRVRDLIGQQVKGLFIELRGREM